MIFKSKSKIINLVKISTLLTNFSHTYMDNKISILLCHPILHFITHFEHESRVWSQKLIARNYRLKPQSLRWEFTWTFIHVLLHFLILPHVIFTLHKHTHYYGLVLKSSIFHDPPQNTPICPSNQVSPLEIQRYPKHSHNYSDIFDLVRLLVY